MAERSLGFTDTLPAHYDQDLVPILFDGFAEHLVARISIKQGQSLLEVACGSGVVSRKIVERIPDATTLVATDLSLQMVGLAKKVLPETSNTQFVAVDGMELPFLDDSLDSYICQFGMMFMPDKPSALRQARRVLRPGGQLLFNVWGPREDNDVWNAMELTLEEMFPLEERPFMPTPFLMSDRNELISLVHAAGFTDIIVETDVVIHRKVDLLQVARGFILGTPLGRYVTGLGPSPEEAIRLVSQGLVKNLGDFPSVKLSALVCTAIA